jgi:hypothetical protein
VILANGTEIDEVAVAEQAGVDVELMRRRIHYYSVREVCGQLVHGCGGGLVRPCLPCLRDKGHEGPCDMAPPEPEDIRLPERVP